MISKSYMKKSPSPYINHIVEATTQISEYLGGLNETDFRKNRLVQDAIVRQLEIIGEACSNLEENFKNSHPKIPWAQIIAMRNKLTHEYWDIDISIIWQAATKEAPELKIQLLELLSQVGK